MAQSTLAPAPALSADPHDGGSSSPSPAVASPSGSGFIETIMDSLFAPGLNNPTHILMNRCFYALFFVLTALYIGAGFSGHVLFLLLVAIALWISVNWFLSELERMPPSVRQTQQIPQDGQVSADGKGDRISSGDSDEQKKSK